MRIVPQEYQSGGSWGTCMRCGFKHRLNEMSQDWTSSRVCSDCWDPRPAELSPPNIYPEGLPRPDASPEPPDVFVSQDIGPDDL